eukprot:TRINITY_DN81230_c0_g1_i1.p1 TRINITY_DN81230_c0_g1~~TRINITY_DN81230_c0_g1_i1.p1  ORF type:complete len:161 (-),score=21.82 TRINITY_DN81230_c0_g1_i1:3-485(-)
MGILAHARPSSLAVWVDRPAAIATDEGCDRHHCDEHPEQSECRGRCRRRAEGKAMDRLEMRTKGVDSAERAERADVQEERMKAAGPGKPPMERCTTKVCKTAHALRPGVSGIIETGSSQQAGDFEPNSMLYESVMPIPGALFLPLHRRTSRQRTELERFL